MTEGFLTSTVRGLRRRKSQLATLILALFGLGLIGLATLVRPTPLLVWNASASAPIGLYRVVPNNAGRGDLVLVQTPEPVRKIASERGYLPSNVPLVKRIAAARGDIVCAAGNTISINHRIVAHRLSSDRLGRPLPSWTGCRPLDGSQVFLLMEGVADSFDSRYFGPIPATAIIGKLVQIWTE
jgi:conjugative transfer signal peptidase TraF